MRLRLGLVAPFLPLLLAVGPAGCATLARDWHEDPVYDAAINHVYPRPLEEVWPEVVTFMARQGYPGQVDPGNFRFVSPWFEVVTGRRIHTLRRYYVEGLRLNAANCRIRIFHNDVHTGKAKMQETVNGVFRVSDGLFPTPSRAMDFEEGATLPGLNYSFLRARAMEFELLTVLEPEVARALYEKHHR